MLILSKIMLGLFLGIFILFVLYWRYRNRIQAMLADQRDKLLHTEESFAKRQSEFKLDFVWETRKFASDLARQLEERFSLSYQVNVYNRMVKETKFSEQKIMELMFEQKRFLLLASVLKNVPMYSKEVDEVWHQMLMFTREYKEFTEGFAGQFIHHAPNVDGVDEMDSKFIFDMMYLEFFTPMPFSEELWGSRFYAEKPSKELLRDIEVQPLNALESRFFFDTAQARSLSREVIARIQLSMRRTKDPDEQARFKTARRQTMTEAQKSGGKSDSYSTPFFLPYIFLASTDDTVPYSDSLGHTTSTASADGGSTGGGGFFGGGSNNCSSGSGGGSSCGSSCGGGGCGSS